MVGYDTFPRTLQFTGYTCGPCCTYSIATFFGADVSYNEVKKALRTDREGTAEGPIVRFLRSQKFYVRVHERTTWATLERALGRGAVVLVGLDGDHYGVVYGYDEDEDEVYLADPSIRRQLGRTLARSDFQERWMRDGLVIRPRRRR